MARGMDSISVRDTTIPRPFWIDVKTKGLSVGGFGSDGKERKGKVVDEGGGEGLSS